MKVGAFGEPCVEHHEAVIFDRGGTQRFQPLQALALVKWERKMDAKSVAHIEITGKNCAAQVAILNTIEARRHELVLYRGAERVWEGSIVQALTTSSLFTCDASDVLTYWEGTALTKRWPNNANDPTAPTIKTQRLQQIAIYEAATAYDMSTTDGTVHVTRWEQQAPPANVMPYVDFMHNPIPANASKTTIDTQPFTATLGQHLYDLTSNGGIHFTVVGRRIVVWDENVVIGRLRIVSERDFTGDFQVIQAGSGFTTIDHVVGTEAADATLPPAVGHAAAPAAGLAYYGPWERVDPTSSENANQSAPDLGALNSAAKSRVNALYPLPLEFQTASGASLKVRAGIGINDLVPGVQIPVVAKNNLREVKQLQRLNSLTVTETAQGETIESVLGAVGAVQAS